MDFTTRQPAPSPSTNRFAPPEGHHEHEQPGQPRDGNQTKPRKSGLKHKQAWAQGVMMFFLLCLVVLVAALLLFIASGNPHETKYVNSNAYQAITVADASGQPAHYFGNITSINGDYIVLNNSYTTTGNVVGDTNPISVISLTCTNFNDSSQLVLNRSHVVSWSNLASDSNAVKAIQSFKSSYPNGQCPLPQQPTAETDSSPAPASTNSSSSSNSKSSSPTSTGTTSKTTVTPKTTGGPSTP